MRNSKRYILALLLTFAPILTLVSCHNTSNDKSDSNVAQETAFFGDSTITVVSTNRPNGYSVKAFVSKDITLLNLTRGDSINQYIPLIELPYWVVDFDENKPGTQYREFNIPVEKEMLGTSVFFMDVNFDGEEELLVEHPGYNRRYYACFDLINGNSSVAPGILTPMAEPPYNNIVGSVYEEEGGICTEFDFKKKTIHIFEQMGCCSHYETWAEYGKDNDWDTPSVRVVRQERVDIFSVDCKRTEIYERKDGELKLVRTKEEEL